jgi:D-tyrosyl-tRNA(Tyr) deacylase
VARGDTDHDAAWLARKTISLRVFDDADGKLNLSLAGRRGGRRCWWSASSPSTATAVKGNRPSYIEAAPPEEGERLYSEFVAQLRALGPRVETGVFRTQMLVEIENDGPVTLILESRGRSAP